MINIVKEGREAFKADTKPQDVCTYKNGSQEQLYWSLGWYKAELDHYKEVLTTIHHENNKHMVSYVKNAYKQGQQEFEPGVKAMVACPFMGQQFVIAYVKGWNKAKEKYDSENNGGQDSLQQVQTGPESGDTLPL